MIDKLKQRELDMRGVLLHIQRKAPFEDLSFEERRILKECYDAGYFEGVVICEMASGRVVAEYRHEPRLPVLLNSTYLYVVVVKDLNFVHEVSFLKFAYHATNWLKKMAFASPCVSLRAIAIASASLIEKLSPFEFNFLYRVLLSKPIQSASFSTVSSRSTILPLSLLILTMLSPPF